MNKIQNVYDNEKFFNEYQKMRATKVNANELIEIPTIKKMLPDLTGKAVLDLGCGAGEMSRYFIEKGASEVMAIDISQNMITVAKSYGEKNIDYRVMPMENIDQINKRFDLIFSSLAFHYVEDFDKLMRDISNLLNQDGVLLYSQENPVASAIVLTHSDTKHIDINGKRYYLLSDYNNVSNRILDWNMTDVKKYHRNYETIINCIVKNGLNIVEIKEPNATEEAIKLVPKYAYYKDRPFFLFVKAKKA